MLEIPTETKRADDLLLGDSWERCGDFVQVESITNIYEDMEDTGYVRVTGWVKGRLEAWTLAANDEVVVEA